MEETATYYKNGDPIRQRWSFVFIALAFWTSFVASFAAVRILDHSHWRSEKEREHASAILIKLPSLLAASLLGLGTVWGMHFVGMAAVTLDHTPMCYNWPLTFLSLVVAVLFMWAGVRRAEADCFRGPDRIQTLKHIIVKYAAITEKGKHKEANRIIHYVALFHSPQYIVQGATLAAAGALTMHYVGMEAVRGPFTRQWSVAYIAASVLIGLVVCIVGFWILFRLLLWKVEQGWLRPVSAAVIATAVCTLHFFGMLSVTYVYNDSDDKPCPAPHRNQCMWNGHQILVLCVGLVVPSLALLVENLINRELLLAYSHLKNPTLTVDNLLNIASRSRDPALRKAAILVRSNSREKCEDFLSEESSNGIEQDNDKASVEQVVTNALSKTNDATLP